MSLESIAIDTLPSVEAELNYTVPMAEKPRDYAYDPPPGVPHSNSTLEPHRFAIRDIRPVASRISLDSHGFSAVRHRSVLRDFQDEEEIRRTYYREAETLLKEVTGANRVFIFDHTIRRHIPGTDDRRNLARQPAREVHVDQTVKSGPQRVRDLLPGGGGRAAARPGPDHQPLAADPRARPGCPAGSLRRAERGAGRPRGLGPRLSRSDRRDLFRDLQPRPSLVLSLGDDPGRSLAAEMLQFTHRWPRAFRAP